jgi:hypothetical protein
MQSPDPVNMVVELSKGQPVAPIPFPVSKTAVQTDIANRVGTADWNYSHSLQKQ